MNRAWVVLALTLSAPIAKASVPPWATEVAELFPIEEEMLGSIDDLINSDFLSASRVLPLVEQLCPPRAVAVDGTAADSATASLDPRILSCLTERVRALADKPEILDLLAPTYHRYFLYPVRKLYFYSDVLEVYPGLAEILGRALRATGRIDLCDQQLFESILSPPPPVLGGGSRQADEALIVYWFHRQRDGSAASLRRLLRAIIASFDPFGAQFIDAYREDERIEALRRYGCSRRSGLATFRLFCLVKAFEPPEDHRITGCESDDCYQYREYLRRRENASDRAVLRFLASARSKDRALYLESLELMAGLSSWGYLITGSLKLASDELLQDLLGEFGAELEQEALEWPGTFLELALSDDSAAGLWARRLVERVDFRTVDRGLSMVQSALHRLAASTTLGEEDSKRLAAILSRHVRYIGASKANVRLAPDSSAGLARKLRIGTMVMPFEEQEEWVRVRLPPSPETWYHTRSRPLGVPDEGWVHTGLLEKETPTLVSARERFHATRDLQERRKWAERAAALAPRDPVALGDLLSVLLELGDFKAAAQVREALGRQ